MTNEDVHDFFNIVVARKLINWKGIAKAKSAGEENIGIKFTFKLSIFNSKIMSLTYQCCIFNNSLEVLKSIVHQNNCPENNFQKKYCYFTASGKRLKPRNQISKDKIADFSLHNVKDLQIYIKSIRPSVSAMFNTRTNTVGRQNLMKTVLQYNSVKLLWDLVIDSIYFSG